MTSPTDSDSFWKRTFGRTNNPERLKWYRKSAAMQLFTVFFVSLARILGGVGPIAWIPALAVAVLLFGFASVYLRRALKEPREVPPGS